VSASLPNSLELTPARCSGSAALSSKTRSRYEAGQTVAAGQLDSEGFSPTPRTCGRFRAILSSR
jgi:hypothetical protein